ncbi:dipeptidyl peptidase 4-like [Lycorma delicatula]|uniref:dipeptidyl peptidase 4-like n=1 Tax=Lycorma delicatula TaxID=130591 RepID=UPI003F519B0C
MTEAPSKKVQNEGEAKKKSSLPGPVKKVVTVIAPKDVEELVAVTPNERNWRGMLIALLVILAVLGLILFSIILLSPPDEGPRVQGTKFTLEHVTEGLFKVPSLNGSWVTDSELVFRDSYGGISIYHADNSSLKTLMTNSTFRQLNAVDYKVSSDLKFVLLISDIRKIYTNTFEARYHIYEVSTQSRVPLSPFEDGLDDNEAPLLQLVVWAPQGNSLAFVYDNDVYYRPHARKPTVHRLTYSGSTVISNGVPDWLYQEELIKSSTAIWFSNDAQLLLYASFNDSMVGQIKYPVYGPKTLYPTVNTIRYPKPGTMNPKVTVWLVNLTSLEPHTNVSSIQLKPLPSVMEDSQIPYLCSVNWAPVHEVALVWLNRRQNISSVTICSAPKWSCHDSWIQKSNGISWLEPGPVLFNWDGTSYLTLLPVRDGEAGYFTHVCLIQRDTRQKISLTHGQLTVTSILAWDYENHIVYFEAAPEGKPGERHVYRVSDSINTTTGTHWQCLTCPVTSASSTSGTSSLSRSNNNSYSGGFTYSGSVLSLNISSVVDWELWPARSPSCLYTSTTFPPATSPRFYLLQCLGPDPPSLLLMDAFTNMKLATLDLHTALMERYALMARPQIKMFRVEVESGFHAHVRLLLPPGLREYEEMAFPLILHVNSRPGSQSVDERWRVDWGTYLASQRNFIVAEVDGRGTGYQGDSMKHTIHHRLGTVDVEDQIAVITYLRDNLKFVDKTRMAVWGKGYGGFATAMILAQDTGLFKCGISVAPITNWAHFNSLFSERIMGTPNVTDNYRGYEESDISKRAGNLRDKPYLLIHGTADNTVHYQHSMILVRAFTEGGILFRQQTYPDENHSFEGVQMHLYRMMESFWDECFGPLDFVEWEVGTSFFSFRQ